MLILGIETSCDETSCAVVQDGRVILSNVIASQIEIHRATGGVVPEVAAREHVVKIVPVIEAALKEAGVSLKDIDAIAVTYGPGLLSSLLIGVNAAMTLAKVLNKPLIPVNHIEGHIYANWILTDDHAKITRKDAIDPPRFPAAVLTVSGGHNELILWKGHGSYKFLGATLDDAAGEAFDKVARLLGLPYPGGPQIQKAAQKGDPTKYPLPRAWLMPQHAAGASTSPFNFSFSGLKTAVLRTVQKNLPLMKTKKMRDQFTADVAASFQEAVCEVLSTKLITAAKKYRVKEIHLAGGVSANARLREWVKILIKKGSAKIPFLRYCTDLKLCTDNAAMIAAAGFQKFKKSPSKYKKWKPISANPNLKISAW